MASEQKLQKLAREMIRKSVWPVASVDEEPEVRLTRWQVYAVGAERHFVGYNQSLGEGRVSTAIQAFDPETRRGVTASGRVYELVGPPGRDPDGEWVFGIWLKAQRLSRDDVALVPPEEFLAVGPGT